MKPENDIYGNYLPSVSGSIRNGIALPGAMELTPIRIPRPFTEGFPPIMEDYPSAGTSYGRFGRPMPSGDISEISTSNIYKKTTVDVLPSAQFSEVPSAFSFPSFVDERRTSNAVRIRSESGVNNLYTSTDGVPATFPRAMIRPNGIEGLGNAAEPLLSSAIPAIKTVTVSGSNEKAEDIKARALFNNYAISYQRFVFSLMKFPALVLVFIALWTLWSRGQYIGSTQIPDEQNADIASLCTGGFLLTAYIFLIQNHYNSYNKAKYMIYLYHLAAIGAFAGAVVALIFSSIAINKLQKLTPPEFEISCKKYAEFHSCLTYQEKLTYASILLGTNLMIVILSLTTMIFGGSAQYALPKKLKKEYLRASELRTYTNQALSF